MAGRILNFDKVITETVTVAVSGGPTWELRDDVPARVMAVAFRVFDIERELLELGERRQARQEQGETLAADARAAEVAEEARLLDADDEATLEVVTAIVRHSYPEVSRDEVAEALTPSARGQIVGVFFPLLLRRFGRPSPSLPDGAPKQEKRDSTTRTAPAASAAKAPTGAGATRSRKR